jgi:hypothetical protein
MTTNISSNSKRRRKPSFGDVANILEKDACVLCSMLKRFHASCMQDADVNHIQALCDFHAWAVAGAADTGAAARILLRLIVFDQQQPQAATGCSVCERVAEEETKRSDEFFLLLKGDPEFQDWMRDYGAICIPHARRLLMRSTDGDRHAVLSVMAQAAARLRNELQEIADNASKRRSSLVLSQAAEFLKGRRGLALNE